MKTWTFILAAVIVAISLSKPAPTYAYSSLVICGYAPLSGGAIGEIGCDHTFEIYIDEVNQMQVPPNSCMQAELVSAAVYRTAYYNSSTQSWYHFSPASEPFQQNGDIHPGTWSGSGAFQHLNWDDENYFQYNQQWTSGGTQWHNDTDDIDVGGITWYRPGCSITQQNVGQGQSNNNSHSFE